MRVLIVVLLAALASSGCLSSSTAPLSGNPAAGVGPSAGALPCPSGTLFKDSQSYVNGGSDSATFDVPVGCSVDIEWEVFRHIGTADVAIFGAGHDMFLYRGTVVDAGPVNFVPATFERREQTGTVPPGTYTYTASADQVLEFSIRVVAA